MKPCKHPEGPEAYHKVVLNVDHATKARLDRALTFYSQGDIDRCTALGLLLDDAREGMKARKVAKETSEIMDMINGVFPGAKVTK